MQAILYLWYWQLTGESFDCFTSLSVDTRLDSALLRHGSALAPHTETVAKAMVCCDRCHLDGLIKRTSPCPVHLARSITVTSTGLRLDL